MDDSGIPLGSVNRHMLLLLNDGYSALILVGQPVRNGGPKDAAANDRDVPRFQPSHDPTRLKEVDMLYSGYALLF